MASGAGPLTREFVIPSDVAQEFRAEGPGVTVLLRAGADKELLFRAATSVERNVNSAGRPYRRQLSARSLTKPLNIHNRCFLTSGYPAGRIAMTGTSETLLRRG